MDASLVVALVLTLQNIVCNGFVWVSPSTSACTVGIYDHWGKPKPFSSDFLVAENRKSTANATIG